MKIAQAEAGAMFLALFLVVSVQAQNVGIGFSNPASKLTVNGNLAIGADYNTSAPANAPPDKTEREVQHDDDASLGLFSL